MAVQIVFSDNTKLRVKYNGNGADLAKVLSDRKDAAYAGQYLSLERKDSHGTVWVNPATVAYLEDWPD